MASHLIDLDEYETHRILPFEDDVMPLIRLLFERSGMTLNQFGLLIDCKPANARKAAWQFLNKVNDPSLGMLRRAAKALNSSPEQLLLASFCLAAGEEFSTDEIINEQLAVSPQ